MPVWTSSTTNRHSCSRAMRCRARRNSGRKWLSPPSAWMGSMMMAGDVVGVVGEGLAIWSRARSSAARTSASTSAGDGEAELGVLDARPRELGEEVGLARVRVGEGEGVAAAAVEGLAEVDHRAALLAGDALGLVAPHLPVERDLERVLDAERAALDEERVLQSPAAWPGARRCPRTTRTRRCRRPSSTASAARRARASAGTRGPASSGGCSRGGSSRRRSGNRGTRGRSGRRGPTRRGSSRSRRRSRIRRRGCAGARMRWTSAGAMGAAVVVVMAFSALRVTTEGSGRGSSA